MSLTKTKITQLDYVSNAHEAIGIVWGIRYLLEEGDEIPHEKGVAVPCIQMVNWA